MPYKWDKPIGLQDDRHPEWFWIEKNVWKDDRLTASDKVLYGTIALYSHGRSQEAFPGIHRLAIESCLSKAQVALSIKKLEELQYISIKRTPGKSNIYRLLRLPLGGVQNLDMSKIRHGGVQNTGGVPVQNTASNNNNINNNYLTRREASLDFLKTLTNTDIEELQALTDASEKQIQEKAAILYDYCQAHGKRYKNYRAFLRNALRRDYPKVVKYQSFAMAGCFANMNRSCALLWKGITAALPAKMRLRFVKLLADNSLAVCAWLHLGSPYYP